MIVAALVVAGLGASAAADSPTVSGDWNDYQAIVWQDQTPAHVAALRRMGFTGGRLFGTRGPISSDQAAREAAPFVAAGWRFYVENIATDFYAAYHRFQPDHPVTWAFDRVRALHADNSTDPAAFRRVPSLSDPDFLATVRERLAEHVRAFAPYRPLYYSLGDETGIADLAAAWDFDFSPQSLAALRHWLRARYATLDALNLQWSRAFADWNAVVPATTTEAIDGPAGNFSAWADFKEFMDEAFARAVKEGTDAVHAADPTAPAGIEGAQVPGWGGYDYARLAGAVDVMEIYEGGCNVEIARGLNPRLIVLNTTTPDGLATPSRLWRALLLGARGLILWDEAGALIDAGGNPSAVGVAATSLLEEFRGGLAAQLIAATPASDPVAILYSPASFRIGWLLDRRADGLDWTARNSEIEGGPSPYRDSVTQAAARLTHLGLQPRWLTEATLADDLPHDVKLLLLPRALALSSEALRAIQKFAAGGGTVLADSAPGLYDAHGKQRQTPPLVDTITVLPDWGDMTGERVGRAGVKPAFSLAYGAGTPATDIDMRMFRSGGVAIIGLQRDPTAHSSATVPEAVLTMANPGHVYDLRNHEDLGWTDRLALRIDATEPRIFAVSPTRLPPLIVAGPAAAQIGSDIVLHIAFAAASPAAASVVHVEARDPSGARVERYSGNLVLKGAPATWRVATAVGDAPGFWSFRVSDRLGGTVSVRAVKLVAFASPTLAPSSPAH